MDNLAWHIQVNYSRPVEPLQPTLRSTMDLLCTERPMIPPSTPSSYLHSHSHIVSNVTRLLCTEQAHHPAVSTKLHDDQRRLGTYLEQENRFMPNVYQMQKLLDEDERTQMLEIIYEVSQNLSIGVFLEDTSLLGVYICS